MYIKIFLTFVILFSIFNIDKLLAMSFINDSSDDNIDIQTIVSSEISNANDFFIIKDKNANKLMRTKGDIVLGGIFPMHEQINTNKENPCGRVKEEKGVQRIEAMLYAIDEINRDESLLPNLSLGVLIIDSCSSDTYALEQSMEFVRYYMNKVSNGFPKKKNV